MTTAANQDSPTAIEPHKQCDLCDGSQFELVAQLDRRGRPLDTVVCTTCGLVAHANIPSDAQLDRYYAEEYRHDYHGEFAPSDRRVLRAWKNGRRLFEQLTPYVDGGDRVFEIGAGIGCNVKAFELAGFDASGIEPGVGFQQYAQTKLLARVENARLFDLPATHEHDLVLLIHVIEHFNSPRKALEHIHGLLRPGGRLYVECPNLAAPFARRSRLFHFAHIHNFTPATLSMMALRCGFRVERQFSTRDDPNLQMLLIRADAPRRVIDSTSYDQTLLALRRYDNFTYHVRWNYVWPRLRKLAGYAAEHLTATRAVRNLLQRCRSHSLAGTKPAVVDAVDAVDTPQTRRRAA
ncbi:MAG: class I SAM-dependent methyltransferase [Pirellulales bacterium]